MPTPRVFLVRHGETAWSLSGRHTSTSDIPLTATGEKRVVATGRALIGPDRLIVPGRLARVYVSPRRRAQRTFELLGIGEGGVLPWGRHGEGVGRGWVCGAGVEVRDAVREWEYGEYEGVTSGEIAVRRREAGLAGWDIWRDGCPGGESPLEVTERVDGLIAELRARFHEVAMGGDGAGRASDVMIVAHGHVLRAFAARWIGRDIADNPSLILEAGGVGTLSYEHQSIHEPAILLGGAFMADAAEGVEDGAQH